MDNSDDDILPLVQVSSPVSSTPRLSPTQEGKTVQTWSMSLKKWKKTHQYLKLNMNKEENMIIPLRKLSSRPPDKRWAPPELSKSIKFRS